MEALKINLVFGREVRGVIGVLNINLVNWGIEYSFRPLRNLKIYLVYWGIDHKSRLFGVIKCKSSFERY